jgi:P27 family predicted phage terminase small subunit
MSEKPKPPKHLSAESRRWFTQISTDYELESHHLKLLQAAAECWDRVQEARKLLAKDGVCFTDRHGHIRPHPATQMERDNKTLFARLLRELALDVEEPNASRPPIIPGRAGLQVRA